MPRLPKASGEPNRLRIYTQIAQNEELFCGEMRAKSEISAATLSHHLKVLSDLGLITSRKYLSDLAHIGHKSRA